MERPSCSLDLLMALLLLSWVCMSSNSMDACTVLDDGASCLRGLEGHWGGTGYGTDSAGW